MRGCDLDDAPAGDADIDDLRFTSADACIAQDQVESHAPSLQPPARFASVQLCTGRNKGNGMMLANTLLLAVRQKQMVEDLRWRS